MIIKIHMANKKDPAENRQDLLQIGILSLWVQYSTRNMGLPSAKRKSDKTQIGLFIGGEVFHFGGDYDIIKTKICTRQYRIILSAAAAGAALRIMRYCPIFFPFVLVKVRFITLALWYNEGIRVYLKKNHGCFAGASHKTALAKNRLFSPFQVHPRQKCKQQA